MTKPKLAVSSPVQTKICPNCWEPFEEREARQYCHPKTGELVPSVTNVISYMPQFWMGPWAAKMSAEYMCANWYRLSKEPHGQRIAEAKQAHVEYAKEKAGIGDVVHNIVDCWGSGQPYPDPPDGFHSYIDKFIDFLITERPKFLENEVTLWSRKYGYAGTADFVIEVGGKVLLADLKTGKSLHSEIGLQLSALAHCDFILRPDGEEVPMPRIDGLAGLHLRPRSWRLVPVNEPEECFSCFLAAQKILHWTQQVSPNVLEAR